MFTSFQMLVSGFRMLGQLFLSIKVSWLAAGFDLI